MENICVFLFSGTGMTKYVIDKIDNEFKKKNIFVDIYYIEDTIIKDIDFKKYDTIGIAYPVHSFNAPEIVIKFANQLPKFNVMKGFIISTAGEYTSINFASSNLLLKVLNKKGFEIKCNKQFIMPSNFVTKYEESKVNILIDIVKSEVPQVVDCIINDKPIEQVDNFKARLMACIGRAEWLGARCIGKLFYVDKSCIRCGICAKNCPNDNIVVTENNIHFKLNCGLCMRCLYLCQNHSIKIRKPFKFIKFELWYENKELVVVKKK